MRFNVLCILAASIDFSAFTRLAERTVGIACGLESLRLTRRGCGLNDNGARYQLKWTEIQLKRYQVSIPLRGKRIKTIYL